MRFNVAGNLCSKLCAALWSLVMTTMVVDAQLPRCVMRSSSTCACDLSFDMGFIDLTPLAHNDGTPAFHIIPPGRYQYFFNPCYSFKNDKCSGDVAVCQNNGANCGKQSTGTITILQATPPFMSILSYTQGADNRQSIVRLICDESKQKPDVVFVSENPKENYNFNLTSRWCCPRPNPTIPTTSQHRHPEDHKIGLGTILDITFLVVIVLYFAGGVAFMRIRREAHGKDLIPNRDFWVSLPGLIKCESRPRLNALKLATTGCRMVLRILRKDGALFIGSAVRGRCGRKGGYSGVD